MHQQKKVSKRGASEALATAENDRGLFVLAQKPLKSMQPALNKGAIEKKSHISPAPPAKAQEVT